MFNRGKTVNEDWEAHFVLLNESKQLMVLASGNAEEKSIDRLDKEARWLAKLLGYSLVLEFSDCCQTFCLTVWVMWFKDRFWQDNRPLLEVPTYYVLGERFRFTCLVELAWTHLCIPYFIKAKADDIGIDRRDSDNALSSRFFSGITNKSKDFLAFHD